jgi:hypothetical protein
MPSISAAPPESQTTLLRHDQNNRWMFLLEWMVVLLFVFEIAKSFRGK